MSEPTAALRIEVQPGDTYVAEPGEIDATGLDYGVLVAGDGPATVKLHGLVVRGATCGLGIATSNGVKISGGTFHGPDDGSNYQFGVRVGRG